MTFLVPDQAAIAMKGRKRVIYHTNALLYPGEKEGKRRLLEEKRGGHEGAHGIVAVSGDGAAGDEMFEISYAKICGQWGEAMPSASIYTTAAGYTARTCARSAGTHVATRVLPVADIFDVVGEG